MKNLFRYFKTSPEIIRLSVMMYIRFPLSLRQVEDLLHERGIDICHETVRAWWNRFGPLFAAEIKKKRSAHIRGAPQWRWHLDEVFVRINGEVNYLWRAVNHEDEVLEMFVTKRRDRKVALRFLRKAMKRYGSPEVIVNHEDEVLEMFVTKRRDRKVALRFLRKAMKRYGSPEVIVTDRLRSYRAAMREIGNEIRQETGRWLNNRAENSHQPFRRRERAMARFRSSKSLQKFASIHASVHNHFNQDRHLNSRQIFKLNRVTALVAWRQLAA